MLTFILIFLNLGVTTLSILCAVFKIIFAEEPFVYALFECLENLLVIIGGVAGIFVVLSGIADDSSEGNNNISSTSGEAKPPPCQVDSERSNKNEAHPNEAPNFVSNDDIPVSSNITSLSTENISSVSTTIFNSTWSGENKLMVEPPDKGTE